MKKIFPIGASAVVLMVCCGVSWSQETITVTLENRNTSLSTDQFEVYDRVCNRHVGTYTIQGGKSTQIQICKGSDGKGSVRMRNPNLNNNWVGEDFIRPGDTISR